MPLCLIFGLTLSGICSNIKQTHISTEINLCIIYGFIYNSPYPKRGITVQSVFSCTNVQWNLTIFSWFSCLHRITSFCFGKKNIYILSGFKLCYYVNFYDIPIKKKRGPWTTMFTWAINKLKAFYLISGGLCSWIIKMFLIHWNFCTLLWDDYTWFYLEDVEIYGAVFDVDALYCYFLPTRDMLCQMNCNGVKRSLT